MDSTQFQTVLRGFLSHDGPTRQQAERQFEELKASDPDNTIKLTLLVLQDVSGASDQELKLQAAVLLRNFFRGLLASETNLWSRLSVPAREQVKQVLLECVSLEKDRVTRMNLCDCISDIATELIPAGEWNQLGPHLFQMIESDSPHNQQAGLHILADLSPVLSEQLLHTFSIVSRWILVSLSCARPAETRVESFAFLVALVEDGNKKFYKKLCSGTDTLKTSIALLLIDTIEATLQVASSGSSDFSLTERLVEYIVQLSEADRGAGLQLLKTDWPMFTDYILALANAGKSHMQSAQAAQLAAQAAARESANIAATVGFNKGPIVDTPCIVAQAARASQNDTEGLESLRKLAIELLICCTEQKPKLVLPVPNFIQRLLESLLLCMLEINDAMYNEWLESGEEEEEERRFYEIGEESLDRLCRAFDLDDDYDSDASLQRTAARIVLPPLYNHITQFLTSPAWQYRFVAIMAISQTVEFLQNETEEELQKIVETLVKALSDEDFRVRFAGCQAIGQLALDQQPYVQETYADTILPALIQCMNDPKPRVRGHACAAFVNFAEELEKPVLANVANVVMSKAVELADVSSPSLVRQHAITCIAVVAGVLEADFRVYYPVVMPALLQFVRGCSTPKGGSPTSPSSMAFNNMRCKAIECVSIVGLGVGKELFAQDASAVMEALMNIYRVASVPTSNADDNSELDIDALREYLSEAIARMCRVLKEDFLPYLGQILPSLLQVLSVTPKELTDQELDGDEDMTYVMIDANKSLGLKTSLIEEQQRALDLLCTVAEVLKDPLASAAVAACTGDTSHTAQAGAAACTAFLQPTAEAVLPLLGHVFSDAVRQKALDTMSALIGVSRKIYDVIGVLLASNPSCNSGLQLLNQSKELVTVLLTKTCEATFSNLEHDVNGAEEMIADAAGLNACVEAADKDILNDEQITCFSNKIFELLEKCFERRVVLAARRHEPDGDLDEDELGELMEDEQAEQTLRSSLLEILGTIMCTHGQGFLRSSGAAATVRFIEQYLADGTSDEDKAIAIYICDDILQHLKESGIPMWQIFMPKLVDATLSTDARVLQASAYGVQQAAPLSAFAPFSKAAASNLLKALCRNNARKTRLDRGATDNVVAAIGDLLQHQSASLSPDEQQLLLQKWFENLPLRQDETEGLRVHKQLMQLVLQENASILGQNNSHLPRLIAIFSGVYKTEFSDDSLNSQIRSVIKSLSDSGTLESLAHGYSAKEQKALNRIVKDNAVA